MINMFSHRNMFKGTILLFAYLMQLTLYAHVGSSEVIMQGNAGPYKLLISVKPPDVIPGIAKVSVYIYGENISAVSFRPVYFRTGDEGSPQADDMKAVASQPGQYTGEVWFMNGGSSSVQIIVTGSRGKGEIIVPVVAIATARKTMPASTGFLLAAMGAFLLVLLFTIVAASVSSAVTNGAEPVTARRKKMRVTAIAIAALCISLVVYGGWFWVHSFSSNYDLYVYHRTEAASSITNANGVNELKITLDTSEEAQRKELYAYIIPDHEKMMHAFIVRIPTMDAFAHLHPIRVDEANYKTVLPDLPEGKYLLFADIVYVSGFNETIKDTFDININITGSYKPLDEDDAYAFTATNSINLPQSNPTNTIVCGKPRTAVKLKDGSTMVWQEINNKPLKAGRLYALQFAVLAPDKKPAMLEAYMGMMGHAAIIRNDGNVYMHLHPMGTLSMAAETNFEERLADPRGEYTYPDPQVFRDSIDNYMNYISGLSDSARENILTKQMNMPGMKGMTMNGMSNNNVVEFPYSFPSSGQYRIWIEVKRNGEVLTAAFDVVVK